MKRNEIKCSALSKYDSASATDVECILVPDNPL